MDKGLIIEMTMELTQFPNRLLKSIFTSILVVLYIAKASL
jgi:hypothetical protein